jgi:two-component system phosphate regulon response regulator PhoB
MNRATILAVDDEEDILELIDYNLSKEGYDVSTVSSGEDALKRARELAPNLIVLDLMLPGIDGLEVCRRIKGDAKTASIPIIMLTAKSDEADIVTGLELGADDYITKPFSPRVLIARIRTVLRRKEGERTDESSVLKIRNLTIDPTRHEVLLAGNAIALTAGEFNILHFLARHPGWVFTRQQIIEGIKGADYPVTDRAIDVQIVSLRKKLGSSGNFIETVRGVGYRIKE